MIGDTVTNRGEAVTLRSAGLRDAEGMRVLQAWVLTNPGGSSIGVTDVPPPRGLGWESRVGAEGAVIEPHTVRDIVLEVERTSKATGSATGIRLQVASDHGSTTVDSAITYTFPTVCRQPS